MFKFVDDLKSLVKDFIGNLFSVLIVIIVLFAELALIVYLSSKDNYEGIFWCGVSFILGIFVWIFGAKFFPSGNKEKELNQRIKDLENKNRMLADEFDMNRMLDNFLHTINFAANLELIRVDTAGYIVKEQLIRNVREILDLNQNYPEPDGLQEKLDLNIPDKIFYVREKQYKQTLGIKLGELSYAEYEDRVYISGLTFSVLQSYNNLPPNGGVDFCVLENTNANVLERRFITSNKYDEFKNEYKNYHNQLFEQEMNEKANSICEQLTSKMHNMLQSKYTNLEFVTLERKNKLNKLDWKDFSTIGTSSSRVVRIACDIFTGLDMVKKVN